MRADKPVRLSDRQVEVLRLVAEGMTDRQIGERLNLSVNTIKRHLDRAATIFDIRNRTALVTIARREGYFE